MSTPDEFAEAEGDIRWNLDRGWRIVAGPTSVLDAGWWWVRPLPPGGTPVPPMALTDTETAVWETMRTGPVALRPKETR